MELVTYPTHPGPSELMCSSCFKPLLHVYC